MSEISINVGYKHIFKKITCPKTYTINQLIGLSFEKFNIDKSENIGELKYNGKSLDNSLPLRLTNLTNNSKIELTVKIIPKEHYVNVKLLANMPTNEVQTLVLKVNSNLVLKEMIAEFENSSQLKLSNHEGYVMQLQVINSKVEEKDFDSITLNSITGLNVTNVLIRLGYLSLNNESKVKEQQNIVKMQLQQQRVRNQIMREQEENNRKVQKTQEPVDLSSEETEPTQKEIESNMSDENGSSKTSEITNSRASSFSVSADSKESTMALDQSYEEQEQTTPLTAQKASDNPQLFIPSKMPNKIYENPEDDYNMTLSQAQIYQQLIRNSAKPSKKTTTQVTTPSQYFIRVKFPDQTILQLDFQNAKEIKLGTLFKKIDELIVPEFVNSYSLKQSYPPFNTIEMSFATNNTFLVDHPCFKAERIVLIWESSSASKGPYVNTNNIQDIKQANELPELVIENNRASLPSDVPNNSQQIPQSTAHKPSTPAKTESRGKQFPKWFKLK